MRSVKINVLVDYEDVCDDIIDLKIMYQFSLSKMLIEKLCVHAFIGINAYMYV